MSLLRRGRAELAGAWRSLRYDMGRRPPEASAGGPDMTSTGMSTFGGADLSGYTSTSDPEAARPGAGGNSAPSGERNADGVTLPRWMVAVTVFGALTMSGAAAAYLGVVHGWGSMVPATPAAADTFPVRPVTTAQARRGQGAAPPTPGRTTATATATRAPEPARTTAPVAPQATTPQVTARPRTAAPVLPVGPSSPDCHCDSPPVPTPTAPSYWPWPTLSPSPEPSEFPTLDPSGSTDPWPSEWSVAPDESVEPSGSSQSGRPHRHRPH